MFYKVLLEVMEEQKLSIPDVARAASLSDSTIRSIISRQSKTVALEVAFKISHALGVPLERLNYGGEASAEINQANLLDKIGTKLNFNHKIPILGEVRAGLPLYADENITGYTYGDYNEGYDYFALRVQGDSMNAARIFEGDIVVVRKQSDVDNGEIAVVLVNDNEATIKRVHHTGTTLTLTPHSTNKKYAPQVYDKKLHSILILGKVIEVKFQV